MNKLKIGILIIALLVSFSNVLQAQDVIEADLKAANNFDTTGFKFQIEEGLFKPSIQSFEDNYKCPDWFRDAKFGIWMVWGINSVAGVDGHYARYMYTQQEPEVARIDRETKRRAMSGYKPGKESVYQYHVKKFGHPSKFGYKDLIPLWKADKFDAMALAEFFKECGAKYIGVMAVHHDNFDLYNSTYQPWNSFRMGPKIDIVGEWKKACTAQNMRFAITSHLSNGAHEHFFYQGTSDTTGPLAGVPYDVMDPKYEGLYGKRTPDRLKRLNPEFAQSWYLRTKELIDKYDPDLLYLDGGLPNGHYGLNLAAHFYNHNIKTKGKLEGIFTIKHTTSPGFILEVEANGIDKLLKEPWQVDNTINPGWFHLENISASEMPKTNDTDDGGMSKATTTVNGADLVRLTGGQVIDNFVDIVSKNGNMMLNVGLRADGSLPETYRHELTVIGKWLKINGEAIFRTRPFTVFGEGPFELPQKGGFNDNEFKFTAKDIRFTQSKDGKTLFIILLDWPGNGAKVTLNSLNNNVLASIKSLSMLAAGEKLKWSQDAEGLHVTMPENPVGDYAYVLKVDAAK
jgi:alpha-L-fucosidase